MHKKIIYINHYAGSLQNGMEFRPFYLAREWQRLGHSVIIVGASFSHLRQVQPQGTGSSWTENIDGVEYLWLRTPSYSGNGVSRLINIFTFLFRLLSLCKVLASKKPDVVIASSTYPLDVVPAKIICGLAKAKLIHEVHDLWPLTLTSIGSMSKINPFIMLLQWAENYSYRTVNRVVSMLECALPYMERHGLSADRFCFIPNGIVKEDWDHPEQLTAHTLNVFSEERQKGNFIVAYAGSMGLANSTDVLIEAFCLLKEYPISLILVGSGPEKESIVKIAKQKNLQSVVFEKPINKKQIPSFLKEADALFIGAPKNDIYKYGVSPNKLLDYMMSARPVVNAIEAGNNWVDQVKAGVTVPPQDPKALAEALIRLSKMPREELLEMGQRGKDYVLQKHLYSFLAKEFLEGL